MIDLAAIDAAIDSRRLLTHPFYKAWEEGKISKEGMRDYATQYYFIECSLTALADGDEWEDEKTHPDLWLKFAEALGLSREEVSLAEIRPATKALIDFNRRAGQSDSSRISALYAYEAQAKEIADVKRDSLQSHYGMAKEGTEFFRVHSAVEAGHAAAGRALLDTSPEAIATLKLALQLHWDFLTQAMEVEEATVAA